MQHFIITGHDAPRTDGLDTIFCPCLVGLTETQADLAFVMPRMDHNRVLRETPGHGRWAGVLASDPFGTEAAFHAALRAAGYRGVANWPSSILLEGTTRQSMSTIPASGSSSTSATTALSVSAPSPPFSRRRPRRSGAVNVCYGANLRVLLS